MKIDEFKIDALLDGIEKELTKDKKPKGDLYDQGYIDGVIDALCLVRNQLLYNKEAKNED